MKNNLIVQTEDKKHYCKQHRENKEFSYYVYAHRRISDNKVFYVGKGCRNRAWVLTGRNSYWERVAEKHGCYVDIIFDNLTDDEAYELEYCTVQEFQYFQEPLTNLTDGGVGGKNPSKETRYKQSIAKKGKKPHNYGKPLPSVAMEFSGNADLKTYSFIHSNGDTFTGTRYELVREFELKLDMIGKLFYSGENRRNRIYGWSLLNE